MSDLLKTLAERRANVWEQAKTHLDTVEAEGREFSAEADETWTRYNDELNGLDKRIADLRELEARQADADEVRAKYADAAKPPAEERNTKPSADDILRKMANGELRAYDFGPDELRDLTKGTTTAGGYTVDTSFYAQLQEHMVQSSGVLQLAPTVLTTSRGENLQIPKTTSFSSADIITEGSSITESDPAFGQVTLGAYKFAFSTQVAGELEQDSAISLGDFLARQGGAALGRGLDVYLTTGTGSSQPKGVVPASTLGVTGATSVSGAFTADKLIDLYHSVIPEYRGNAKWFMSDTALAAVRKLKDSNNQYLWQPSLQVGDASNLIGKPVIVGTNVAVPAISAKSVLFGDFSTYFVRQVSGIRVERSVDFAFQNDLVTWRFILRADANLIDTTGAVKHFVGGAS